MFTTYALVDPRTREPFYVGVTENVYKRLFEHLQCSGSNLAKNARIMELRGLNMMVIMNTLQQAETREQGLQQESYWIAHYTRLGYKLFNILGVPSGSAQEAPRKRRNKQPDIIINLVAPAQEKAARFAQAQTEKEAAILSAARAITREQGRVTRIAIRDRLGWNNKQYPIIKAVCDKHEIAKQ